MTSTTRRDFVALTGVAATALVGAVATQATAAESDASPSFDEVLQEYNQNNTEKTRSKLAIYVVLAHLHASLEKEFRDLGLVLPLGKKALPSNLPANFDDKQVEPLPWLFKSEATEEEKKGYATIAMRINAVTARHTADVSVGVTHIMSHKG
ncbi:hypothetical protein NKJ40_24005 [Mesorhizobium sp. M0119]|uniref:hypothetical protein n=1 Tax=unclassified Mesorhizobium TaxID=325217 RepID=UPI00333CB31D